MHSKTEIIREPFLLFCKDNYFNKEFYNKLKGEIRIILNNKENLKFHTNGQENDGFYMLGGGNGYGDNIKDNLYFEDSVEFLKHNYGNYQYFNEVLDYFTSNKFCNFINKKLEGNSFNFRKIKFFSPKKKISLLEYIFFKPLYVSIKLSQYSNGGKINIHRDNPKKYFAFLYYLGFTDNQIRGEGGTQFYKANNNSKFFEDHDLKNENEMELFKSISPVDNRMCAFKISNESWHGVSKLSSLPENCYRMNIQVNLMKFEKFDQNLTFILNILKSIKKFFRTKR